MSLEIVRKALIDNIGGDWEIKEYRFGRLLKGNVQIDDLSEVWSIASIFICDKNIPHILDELMYLNMNAPFEVVEFSNRYQIITWASPELENIRKVINIVKKTDS